MYISNKELIMGFAIVVYDGNPKKSFIEWKLFKYDSMIK